MGSIVTQLLPKVREPGSKPYRELARGSGAYAAPFEGYRPYLADHEPPHRTTTEARARIVFERALAAEQERASEIAAFLDRRGLRITSEPSDWDAIGGWIYDHIEGSREPGSSRYSPLIRDYAGGRPPSQVRGESTTEPRPIWHSVAFDLSLALGRYAIGLHPGGRWIRDGDMPDRAGSVTGEPFVAYAGRDEQAAPFSRVQGLVRHALLVRLGLVEAQRVKLGDALRADAIEPPPILPSGAEAFIEHLRQHLADNGELPEEREIGWMLSEHDLDEMPPLPPDLADQLRARGVEVPGAD